MNPGRLEHKKLYRPNLLDKVRPLFDNRILNRQFHIDIICFEHYLEFTACCGNCNITIF